MASLRVAERHYERSEHDHTTPIGVVHQLVVRWSDADRTTSRRAFRRWCDGVAFVDVQARIFADYWTEQNSVTLACDGPLWVVLGDSTAQGIGASSPLHGYVGQTLATLNSRPRRPWRILNLSRAGAQAAHVLNDQLPLLKKLVAEPDLVTCGIGSNDILGTVPKKVHSNLRQWRGKLAPDLFPPNDRGYQQLTNALLAALPIPDPQH